MLGKLFSLGEVIFWPVEQAISKAFRANGLEARENNAWQKSASAVHTKSA
jgi:hypothetical protein